ncbi:MAG: ABC transporter ATP-binding protein [Woeseia sp.]|nr:ABC transporter ATP-binding protein [Woeseia sp.]|tara:strand:+ start:1180 stop:3093 length:1914 start_codon:yes stop_codon:yes gene_type:complete
MSLIRFEDVSLDFGDQKILTGANLTLEAGERVCLIGRNGAGKSTTFRLITGEIDCDDGEIVRKPDIIVSELNQTLPDTEDLSVYDVVRSGLNHTEKLLDQYRKQSQLDLTSDGLRELETLQKQIETRGGWNIEQYIETIVSELDLPIQKRMSQLSGGWRRRTALAKALVQKPDLLLLDEPTNHLDIATITWLETVIRSYPGAVLFVTHDRAFLQRLATRIVEIDRGQLKSWPGSFQKYLRRKEEALHAEARANEQFDKKLAQEEIWIRQGIKARRTRNEGRVRALMKMRELQSARVGREQSARIHIEEAEASGKKVLRAKNISYSYDKEQLIENFSINIMRGDRIGILGNNGAGKTTLLRLLLGELKPDSGTVKHGSNIEFGYFDQLRGTLDENKSVAENVGDGRTYIRLNGKERHVIGYLKGFLFTPKRAQTKIKALSGGERNRIILAKLFTQPANLLILDEPTNDLDIETLEVLEAKLIEYNGTLIVVSHDREFLDNVVTSTIVFEAGGNLGQYVGGYSDWLRQGQKLAETERPEKILQPAITTANVKIAATLRKLTYKEQRELENLPGEIEALESEVAALAKQISSPDFYSQAHTVTKPILEDLSEKQTKIEHRLERWTALEDKLAAYKESRTK